MRAAHAGRLMALAMLTAAGSFGALAADKTYIYQCEIGGKKVTSDRPIPECANKDQRQLNTDGSLKAVIAPTLTDDERAERDRLEREAEVTRVARNDAVRRDRNLMQRFPNEAAHKKARDKALDDLRVAVKNSEARIGVLTLERKKLEEDKEFYVNDQVKKPLPTMLKQKLDANEAALEAQRTLSQDQQVEYTRINDNYDYELTRLKKLWAGAQPGSLGPVPQVRSATASPSPSALKTTSQ